MKILISLIVLILVGCGGSASVGRDGDAKGGDGVKVDVVVVDGTSPAPLPPPVTYAQYCQTQWGTCQMSVAMLKGQSCSCYWANGSVSYGTTF